MIKIRIFILTLTLIITSSHAEWVDSIKKESKGLYDSVTKKFETKELTKEEIKEERFSKLWENVFEEYKDGVSLLEGSKHAPDSAWFKKDKLDYEGDLDKVLNNIIEILTDDDLLSYKNEIEDKRQEISELNSKLTSYREKSISAPKESLIHTTKLGYKQKTKDIKDEITIFKNDINIIKNRLKKRFSNNGIKLSLEQIDVLLIRVDGYDIIQMTVIMDILNNITEQILKLVQANNEELQQTKRYYGMHLVTWQLVVHIQQQYIEKLNHNFLPQVEYIISQTDKIIEKTNSLYEKETNSLTRDIYQKNLNTQYDTKKVAQAYMEKLIISRTKMLKAQKTSLSNLELARNTYETVSLSNNLYSVIAQSQMLFNEIIKIQMPDIVPFENQQIQQKYQEITGQVLNAVEQ